MNKKFKQYFEQNGFELSSRGVTARAYGYMRGYEVNAVLTLESLKLHISFHATDEQREAIIVALDSAKLIMTAYELTDYGVCATMNDNLTVGRLMKRLPDMLNVIFDIIEQNGARGRGVCPICGRETDELRPFDVDGVSISMDSDCALNINYLIEAENEVFTQAPGNYGRGFLGALLGSLAGAAVAAILFYIGYVSSFSALLAIVLGVALYTRFGGKRDKLMVLIVAATSIVCMLGTVFGYYVISSGIAAVEAGVELTAMEAFLYLMQESPEFASGFRSDLLMMLLFSLLGVVLEVVALARGVKRRSQIK